MTHRISDACVSCGACQPECPVTCISEGEPYVIDESVCIDCGNCRNVCPVAAPEQVTE